MKILTLALAVSLALVAGCDRKATTPPSPKTDSSSEIPQAAAGSSTTPANLGNPTSAEKKEGANPVQGQVDPKDGTVEHYQVGMKVGFRLEDE